MRIWIGKKVLNIANHKKNIQDASIVVNYSTIFYSTKNLNKNYKCFTIIYINNTYSQYKSFIIRNIYCLEESAYNNNLIWRNFNFFYDTSFNSD
jgi:hypothetical protein